MTDKGIRRISNALISVYHKEGLDEIAQLLHKLHINIYSTGGTLQYIKDLGFPAQPVEGLTGYPSILGGRVKTLHPKIFGGILSRRENANDQKELEQYEIPPFDLVIVDLYPFEETVASGASEQDIIEKIDIGGISLIRAGAKNHKDVLMVSSREQYGALKDLLRSQNGESHLEQRKQFALEAFSQSSHYDSVIFNYFQQQAKPFAFKQSTSFANPLRYGENPHQTGIFYGNINEIFTQLHGKEVSYNNLLDIDAAINLMAEFDAPTIAILKHNNACGLASRETLLHAWTDALAADPVSAFGGIIIANRPIDLATAKEMNKLFFEVLIAPHFDEDAMQVLKAKKNRILLQLHRDKFVSRQFRSILNGVLVQEKDIISETVENLRTVTKKEPASQEIEDLLFANRIVKHSKSNAIVLAKNGQLIASGVGETSRVDALKHAIEKAKTFQISLQGAVMASDAFFPFADSIEIAHEAGITSVIQPGGSVRDQETIDFCDQHNISMVFTGIRHFKH